MLKRDSDGLWDVRVDGKKYTPHFGEGMMHEMGEALPLAMGISKLMATGIANVTEKVRDKVLTEEEKLELEQKQANQSEKGLNALGDLENATANNFVQFSNEMNRGNQNLNAIGKSLFKKALNVVKEKEKKS